MRHRDMHRSPASFATVAALERAKLGMQSCQLVLAEAIDEVVELERVGS
jgi:hypothetical protein